MREDKEKQLKFRIYYLCVKHDRLKKESKDNRIKIQNEKDERKQRLLKIKACEISKKIRINRKEIKLTKLELDEFNKNKTKQKKILNKKN